MSCRCIGVWVELELRHTMLSHHQMESQARKPQKIQFTASVQIVSTKACVCVESVGVVLVFCQATPAMENSLGIKKTENRMKQNILYKNFIKIQFILRLQYWVTLLKTIANDILQTLPV